MTLEEQVERVPGVALVEHHLTAPEPAPTGDAQHLASILFG